MTPTKSPHASRPLISEKARVSENANPNLSTQSPLKKPINSPAIGSAKSKKPTPKTPTRTGSFQSRTIQERKFVVAKKKSKLEVPTTVVCKCKEKAGKCKKCPCIAFESLPSSQEDFFGTRRDERRDDLSETIDHKSDGRREAEEDRESKTGEESEGKDIEGIGSSENETETPDPEETEFSVETGSLKAKRLRNRMLEEARSSISELGSGRVLHLVKAFESILTIPSSSPCKDKEHDEKEERRKVMKWALPGLRPKAVETEVSPSSFLSGDLFFASKNLDMDSAVSSSSIDSSSHGSIGSRISRGGRSRRNSSESSERESGRKWEKQLRVTSQQPFKLRTEQRGRFKKEEFHKKVEEMIMEEKKQRIPIAQGLPWTTDEPECLVKPPMKDNTTPLDLILHSDVRAVERAEFDNHVAEKLSLMEQYRLKKERQQKLEEEEEIRRLRRELVPRAQPMPYFDRPFIPKRSLKHSKTPKESRFRFLNTRRSNVCHGTASRTFIIRANMMNKDMV
ncbi:hypothetical protein AAC387_Pa05g1656 [Persea americana]